MITTIRPLMMVMAVLCLGLASTAHTAVGLTTVPERENVRLTIYNSVDLTLAQERRELVLKKGMNYIQYQWAGTLIDTTSLDLRPLKNAADIEIIDMIYPPGAPATLIWRVESEVEGPVPFEISYFTSGLSWSADYTMRASTDESTAEVEGTVAVINHSGETYPRAEVRLVLGSINLVETIRDLATGQLRERRRQIPAPASAPKPMERKQSRDMLRSAMMMEAESSAALAVPADFDQNVEVVSARLADYHIFTLSGTQKVENGATSRFLAIETEKPMPLEVLYRVTMGRPGYVQKLYRFINDEDHHLPKDGPLPDGRWNVFRVTDANERTLSFSGSTHNKYVPPGQKSELNLGHDPAVAVKETYLGRTETDHEYSTSNSIRGWVTHRSYTFKLVNTKTIPISLEYLIPTGGGDWEINNIKGERRSQSMFRHQANSAPGEVLELGPFTISSRQGTLANRNENQGKIAIKPLLPHKLPAMEVK